MNCSYLFEKLLDLLRLPKDFVEPESRKPYPPATDEIEELYTELGGEQ